MKYLRLFFAFFRVGVLSELAYRVNFFVQLFQSLVELGTALLIGSDFFLHEFSRRMAAR
jgi:ABC-2 type transport system permease protein